MLIAKLISPASASGERAASATIRRGVVSAWTCTMMPFRSNSRHVDLNSQVRNRDI